MAKNGQHGIPLRSLEARVACPEVPPNQRQSQQQQRFHADTMTSGTRHPTREQRSLEFRFAYHRGEDCPGKGGSKTLRQTWWVGLDRIAVEGTAGESETWGGGGTKGVERFFFSRIEPTEEISTRWMQPTNVVGPAWLVVELP